MPIHPLAVVDPTAEVHPEAIVGPFCVVRGAVILEAGVELRNHATVYGRSRIGAGTIVFPGAVIGSDPQDLKFRGEDSETVVGERCRIHEGVTISKGTEGGGMRTVLGNECLIMAHAHVAHDCILDDNVVVGNNTQLAGHIHVGRRAVIGAMCGLHHFVTIGELSMVGSMSGVRFDAPPFMIVDGNPAQPRSVNHIGLRRDDVSEEHIAAVREAFRHLYHDRAGKPLSEAVARVRASLAAGAAQPVHRLCTWLEEHLRRGGAKGRMSEAQRQPVVGGRPDWRATAESVE